MLERRVNEFYRNHFKTFLIYIPMRKTIKTILIALLFSNIIHAKTIQVASPGADKDIQPAIQTAVNGAVNGDIIVLPAGQFIVNKSVVISKFISIKGQGMGQTILYRSESTPDATLSNDGSWRAILRFTINSTASSGIVVSDLTLKSKKPSLVTGDGLSVASDIGIEMVRCLDFVITNCHFENFGNGGVSILHDDNLARGLIYKCEFVHNCKGYDALGLGYGVVIYGMNDSWIADPKFGSGNFIFIEDNIFDYHRHSVAGGGCALYVFRYNTVRNNVAGNTAHAIDAHEARLEAGSNYYSTRAIEVYNNSIINTLFKDGTTNCPNGTAIVTGKSPSWLVECAIRTRGGEALIHDNYIEGYRFGVGLVTPKLTSTYPSPYQQGYASGKKYGTSHTGVDTDKSDGDVFIWKDSYKSYAPTNSQCVYFYNYTPDFIIAERDYHLYAKAGYATYTYPHPLRNTTIPTTSLALNVSNNNITCNGAKNGTATVTASGGTGSYTYNWSSSPVQTTATATNLAAGTYTVTVKDAAGTAQTATATITEPVAMNPTATSTQEACGKKNGTATVTVSGGVSPYTYAWTTSPVQTAATATGLSAGNYSVTVTDKNACAKTIPVVINTPSTLTATTALTQELCGSKNGTATVTVSGGTLPYTYAWTTSPVQTANVASGLSAGNYSVTVTDKNTCTLTVPVVITAAAGLTVTATTTTENCGKKDGTATATVSGGTSPFTYSWTTLPVQTTATATGLTAGGYTVTVTDKNGCSGSVKAIVTAVAGLTVTVPTTTENCGKKDGTATATVSGGTAPFTYSWTTSPVQTTQIATGLSAGSYTVTVTDKNGCAGSTNSTVTGVAGLTVTAPTTTDNCGKKDGTATATVSGGTAPFTYSWTTLPVQTTQVATGLTAGGYTVTVTDKNGCSGSVKAIVVASAGLTVTAPTTTENCGKKDGTATATVSGGTAPFTYSWTTLPVQTTQVATGLTAGGYTVNVTDKNGCAGSVKAIVTTAAPLTVTTTLTPENGKKKDGTATANVSGGTAPYTYSWTTLPIQTTPKATGLTAGGYTVTVTDKNACSIATPVVIKRLNAPVAKVTTTDVPCTGPENTGSATVDVTEGVGPYTYQWNTVPAQTTATAANLKVGEYEVLIKDSEGNEVASRVTIAKAKANFVLTTAKTDASCGTCTDGTASVVVSGADNVYAYKWSATWNSSITNSNFATGLAVGNYSVTVTDNNGCAKEATTDISTNSTTGINSAKAERSDVTLFPNPTESKFSIMNGEFNPNESVLVVLYNTAGVEVYSKVTVREGEVIAVDTEHKLEPGIYVVVASSQDHLYKKKIIITK